MLPLGCEAPPTTATAFYLKEGIYRFAAASPERGPADGSKLPRHKDCAWPQVFVNPQICGASGLSICSSIHFTKSRTLGTSAECSG
ncbi:hypothetical protein C1886_03120 [Pseudomonas sp. FW300-N1A1]|nr:hypothetical protein C1886_03120 [Pseudomonas sp. FW300-N1A1]